MSDRFMGLVISFALGVFAGIGLETGWTWHAGETQATEAASVQVGCELHCQLEMLVRLRHPEWFADASADGH